MKELHISRRRRVSTPQAIWRPRTPDDAPLEAHITARGVIAAGHQRCHVLGLQRGDCQNRTYSGALYCSYHERMAQGLIEPEFPESYPAWPLPENGYVMLVERELMAA